jgi:hypothetical protein
VQERLKKLLFPLLTIAIPFCRKVKLRRFIKMNINAPFVLQTAFLALHQVAKKFWEPTIVVEGTFVAALRFGGRNFLGAFISLFWNSRCCNKEQKLR